MGASPRCYPAAFRAEAVDLVRARERSLPQIARDLGINEQTLRNWVKRAEIDAGRGDPGALTTDERAELVRLRRENRLLQQEREILNKAAAWFAKETLWTLKGTPLSVHPCAPGRGLHQSAVPGAGRGPLRLLCLAASWHPGAYPGRSGPCCADQRDPSAEPPDLW